MPHVFSRLSGKGGFFTKGKGFNKGKGYKGKGYKGKGYKGKGKGRGFYYPTMGKGHPYHPPPSNVFQGMTPTSSGHGGSLWNRFMGRRRNRRRRRRAA